METKLNPELECLDYKFAYGQNIPLLVSQDNWDSAEVATFQALEKII